jgi:hypothetical protein
MIFSPESVPAVDEGDVLQVALLDVLDHRGGLHLLVAAAGHEVLQCDQRTDHGHHEPQPGAAKNSFHVHLPGFFPVLLPLGPSANH